VTTVDKNTADSGYADRLESLTHKRWKVILDVQRPYRWNLKRLNPGITLDVGCGVGRHLVNLPHGSVGIDFNEHSVSKAKSSGYDAYTPDDFFSDEKYKDRQPKFDSILLSHVLEHLTLEESHDVLSTYLPYLKKGGRVIVICPQEKGYASPPKGHAKGEAHVTFLDSVGIQNILRNLSLGIEAAYSFPFPRRMGKIFRHNETVVVGKK
jgi:2-polyprenyl-3-methyl-5-hydroxy-6-metoxy-1,4-benzoquinol methylase